MSSFDDFIGISYKSSFTLNLCPMKLDNIYFISHQSHTGALMAQCVYFRIFFVKFCFWKMDIKIQKKFKIEKGKPCLLVDGYKFSESKVLKKYGNIRYRCTNKNCTVSLLVDKNVTKVLSMLKKHIHDEILENIISRRVVSSRLKRKCENDLLIRPNKIIRQKLRNTEKYIQPVYSYVKLWRKCMYDKRKKICNNWEGKL
jgi:hypothetical protein